MPDRETLAATVRVALPLEHAMHLFTPVGERALGRGLGPRVPRRRARRRGVGGHGFVTGGDGHGETTFWAVAERRFDLVRYARVTPGRWAGTVEVQGTREDATSTLARVTYDLTALSAEGRAALDEFAAGYEDYIASWEREIAAAISRTRPPATP